MTTFTGTAGADVHFGAELRMYGYAGDDRLIRAGSDLGGMMYGGAGNDHLTGSLGDDVIRGGRGDDIIEGLAGRDILIGGKGADTFRFSFANVPGRDGPVALGVDRILDFKPGKDTIEVASMGYADPVLIYQSKKGLLLVDFDGKGGLSPVKFARIDKGLDIKDGDLVVVA